MYRQMDDLAQLERFQDYRNQVARDHLIRMSRNTPTCRVLCWMGKQLVAWGQTLQDRYQINPASQVLRTSSR